MPTKRMGYEGVLYIGTAGTQATTQLVCATDIDYTNDLEMGETTCRGDGTSVPIKSEKPSCISAEITFKVLNTVGVAALATLLAAARTPSPLAIYYKDAASGKGFDGDMNIKVKLNTPLKGEQTYEFTCTVNDESRTPSLNAS